jgi:hypothetical protein
MSTRFLKKSCLLLAKNYIFVPTHTSSSNEDLIFSGNTALFKTMTNFPISGIIICLMSLIGVGTLTTSNGQSKHDQTNSGLRIESNAGGNLGRILKSIQHDLNIDDSKMAKDLDISEEYLKEICNSDETISYEISSRIRKKYNVVAE